MAVVPVVLWLGCLALLAALAFPLTVRLLRDERLAAALALPVALAVVTLVTLWVGRHSLLAAPLVGVGILAGLSTLAHRRGDGVPPLPSRQTVSGPLTAFAVAFAAMLALRLAAPGIVPAGGEKFLDFALLKTLLTAGSLPAEDPWFAGEPIRYYYGGQLVVAAVARLTATPAAYAYPLGLATAYGTLVAGAYGVAGTLATGRERRLAGAFGAFLVAAGGPLVTPVRLALGALPEPFVLEWARVAFVGIRAPLELALTEQGHLATYSPWADRYVVPDVITVPPVWEFDNGDLHAHVVATPFLVVVVGLVVAYLHAPAGERRRRWALLVAGAVVAGLLGFVNLWSLPAALGVLGLGLAFAPAHPATLFALDPLTGRVRAVTSRVPVALGALVPLVGIALAVAAPFYGGGTPTSQGVALVTERSPLLPTLLVYGLVLAPVVAGLLAALRRSFGRRVGIVGAGGTLAVGAALLAPGGFATLVALTSVVVLGLVVALEGAPDGPDGPGAPGRVASLAVLAVGGAGLLLVTEVVYARVWPFDPNAPRWNTVYKVSIQAWVLWALAGGAVLARCWRTGQAAVGAPTLAPANRRRLVRVGVACLVLSGAMFGAIAAGSGLGDAVVDRSVVDGRSTFTVHEPQVSLDATTAIDRRHPNASRAIDWLDGRRGVVVEAPGVELYQWTNPASTLTGLATIAGWSHEAGYRGAAAYDRRVATVDEIYTGSWANASDALARHDVRYVYVGAAEHDRYGSVSFAGLRGVTVAHRSGNVTVYAVDTSALGVRESYRGTPRDVGTEGDSLATWANPSLVGRVVGERG